MAENVAVDCGWGRLLFAQTFPDLPEPGEGAAGRRRRDGATSRSTCAIRTWCWRWRRRSCSSTPPTPSGCGWPTTAPAGGVRAVSSARRLRTARTPKRSTASMPPAAWCRCAPDFFWTSATSRVLTYFVAGRSGDQRRPRRRSWASTMRRAFGDPENGSSLWCLAVDPAGVVPGHRREPGADAGGAFPGARRAAYMDLSVLHDNDEAIALYEKLGFQRVPVFAVKTKNPINEKLFVGAAAGRRRSTPTPGSSSTRRAGAASASRSSMPRAASSA